MRTTLVSTIKWLGALALVVTTALCTLSSSVQVAGASTATTYCYAVQSDNLVVVGIPSNSKLLDIETLIERTNSSRKDLENLKTETPNASLTTSVDGLINITSSYKTILLEMKKSFGTTAYRTKKADYLARLTALAKSSNTAYNSLTRALFNSYCKSYDKANGDAISFAGSLVPKYGHKARGIKLSVLQAAEQTFPVIKVIGYNKDKLGNIIKVQIHEAIGASNFCNNLVFTDPTGYAYSAPTPC
jgi:hypothetical protein